MKHPRNCIFCGFKGRITKEHFWSVWLSPHLSQINIKRHYVEFYEGEVKQPKLLRQRFVRQGPVVTKKLRVVCSSCNNQWMSEMETATKSIILNLLNKQTRNIELEAIKPLALWAAVKTIVAEHGNKATALTIAEDRFALFKEFAIPSYFRIFVALSISEDHTNFARHSATISRNPDGPDPPLPSGISRNIQSVSFLVGRLFFYVTAVRAAGIDRTVLDPDFPMHLIWPSPEKAIDLHSTQPLNNGHLFHIATKLERLMNDPLVRYRDPQSNSEE